MFYKQSFGERARSVREKEGKSMETIAAILGCPVSHVEALEQGKVQPTLEVLVALAGYYQVSTDYLLGLTDIPFAENGASD